MPIRFFNFLATMVFLTGIVLAQDKSASYVSAPKFELSEDAAALGIDGMITARLSVNKNGSVKKVEILGGPTWPCESSPDPEIRAVHEAIRQNLISAKFEPARQNGEPVDSDVQGEFPIGPTYRSSLREDEARKQADQGKVPSAVNAGTVNGRAVKLPRPSFPDSAQGARLGGTIRVQVLIDEDGMVKAAGALQGQAALRKAARTAACKAKFSPTLIAGKPVKVWGVITYNFFFRG